MKFRIFKFACTWPDHFSTIFTLQKPIFSETIHRPPFHVLKHFSILNLDIAGWGGRRQMRGGGVGGLSGREGLCLTHKQTNNRLKQSNYVSHTNKHTNNRHKSHTMSGRERLRLTQTTDSKQSNLIWVIICLRTHNFNKSNGKKYWLLQQLFDVQVFTPPGEWRFIHPIPFIHPLAASPMVIHLSPNFLFLTKLPPPHDPIRSSLGHTGSLFSAFWLK